MFAQTSHFQFNNSTRKRAPHRARVGVLSPKGDEPIQPGVKVMVSKRGR
jgi:hypothetical protein